MTDEIKTTIRNLFENYSDEVLSIVAIVIGAWVVKRFGILVIRGVVRDAIKHHHHDTKMAEKQREDTIIQIVSNALNVLIGPIALIVIVGKLGVDITPLIAGVSIFGVALGFGAQSFVKDIISGLFIIIENQYRVGDVVDLDGAAGQVEHITLRATVLRDLDGVLHHIPNGTIDRVSNMSKDYSGINLDIGVAYESDIDHVIEIINQVGESLANEEAWKDKIIEAPNFLRVDELADSSIVLKVTGKVKPLEQWAISGEMRRRLKKAFDASKIEIPFPQVVVHQKK